MMHLFDCVPGKKFGEERRIHIRIDYFLLSGVFLMLYYLGVWCILWGFSLYNLTPQKVFETFPIVSESGCIWKCYSSCGLKEPNALVQRNNYYIESCASSFTSFGVSFNLIFIKIR